MFPSHVTGAKSLLLLMSLFLRFHAFLAAYTSSLPRVTDEMITNWALATKIRYVPPPHAMNYMKNLLSNLENDQNHMLTGSFTPKVGNYEKKAGIGSLRQFCGNSCKKCVGQLKKFGNHEDECFAILLLLRWKSEMNYFLT